MGISLWQLLIVLVIVLLLFGTKRLKNIGGDLGGAIKGFKKAMNDDESRKEEPKPLEKPINQQATRVDEPANKTESQPPKDS